MHLNLYFVLDEEKKRITMISPKITNICLSPNSLKTFAKILQFLLNKLSRINVFEFLGR